MSIVQQRGWRFLARFIFSSDTAADCELTPTASPRRTLRMLIDAFDERLFDSFLNYSNLLFCFFRARL
jgi:hypothetical protein